MTDFEKAIRKACIDRDITLREFAEQAGMSLGYLYELFDPNKKADRSKLKQKIKELLNI